MKEIQKFFVATHAILKAGNKVLVLHKSQISYGTPCDLWTFPGGKIDQNESEPETLRRELQEELGFNSDKDFNYKFLTYYIPSKGFKTGERLLILKFIVEIESEFEPKLSAEHDGYKWVEWEEFLDLELHFEKVRMRDLLVKEI